jgi:hypothetical protein
MKYIRVDRNVTRSFASSAKRLSLCLAAAGALFALTGAVKADSPIYSNDLNTDNGSTWLINYGSVCPPCTNVLDFEWDYSKAGIPPAPHTTDGSTIGLRMSPDYNNQGLGSVVGAGLSVSPTDFSITANFDMHVDMWVNVNCTAYATPGGLATGGHNGSSSSVCYGCGYGTAGTTAQIAGTADSIYVGTLADNGSSAQMRMYAPNFTGSFQNGTYQNSGTSSPAFPGDPYVYNSAGGVRGFANLAPWNTIFPSVAPPAAQILEYNQQTNNVSVPGCIDFAWHDVEIQKIGTVIVYSIDGHVVATANSTVAGAPAGSYLEFLAFDINGNGSTDPNYTNLNFVVFDNIRVYNYNNIVSVQATQPNASEVGPTPGTFTISRTSVGVPLDVNFTLTGSAVIGSQYNAQTNGVTYPGTPTSVHFAANDSSETISIVPIDDGIPNLPTTVILTIQPGTDYTGANSDTVNIADGDTPTVDITASQATMYERYASNPSPYQDFCTYTLTRRGRVTAPSTVTLNVASANAVAGVDYAAPSPITMLAGINVTNVQIFPVRNPAVTGNKTITVTVNSVSGGGAVGNAVNNSTTIVDSDYAPSTQVLNDPLTDGSAGEIKKWFITYGTGDEVNHATDFNVDFGYTLASAAIPAPPGGSPTALHITCNKASGTGANVGAPGGVNVYYTNQPLSGNYAVRFNMDLVEGETSLNTWEHEGALFGINHSGTQSNWWYAAGTETSGAFSSDGVWYYVGDQYGGTLQGEYQGFVGGVGLPNTGWTRVSSDIAPNWTSVFKSGPSSKPQPGPFTSLDDTLHQTGGVAAEADPNFGYDASTWTDVEIKQINGVVTLSINRSPIFTYTNSSAYQSGYLMLGYSDPYGDGEDADSSVYYANLTVAQLVTPIITQTALGGGNVTLTFTGGTGDAATTFTLQSSSNVAGPYADVSPAATITALGGTAFRAVAAQNGTVQFYRLRRND